MASLVAALDRRFYPGVQDSWDNLMFRDFVLERIRPSDRLLDYGAGRGSLNSMDFRSSALEVCGVDISPSIQHNPHLNGYAVLGLDGAIPYGDASFDVALSSNVIEHLEHPVSVFREVHRVLKPGGRFLFKTPNAWHYMPVIARLTPFAFHRFYNRLRGRKDLDTFPTVYAANTRRALEHLAWDARFVTPQLHFIESRPEYLRLSALTYMPGIAYERLVNRFSALAQFRSVIIGELRKP